MVLFGNIVIYVIMVCAFIGCMAYVFQEESELGRQYLEGIYSIGTIFIPVAGITASAPFLSAFIKSVFAPLYQVVGADASMAATTFIAVDMGGYQLAQSLATTKESWIISMYTGYMAGATIVYIIPVALKILRKEDQPYLALGMMAGFITVPVGVFVSSIITALSNPYIREVIATDGEATYQLALSYVQIFRNILPLIVICGLLTLGLVLKPKSMIKGFAIFGKTMNSALTIILMLCTIEYFTGVFTRIIGTWGFEPIIADTDNINRALEIAGYIGIMLSGAFPMVWLIQKYCSKPLRIVGRRLGLSEHVIAGVLAGAANALALFKMIEEMEPREKVQCLSFSVCGSFLIGDHLSFTANYQPSLILPMMAGKFTAACLAVFLSTKLKIPNLEQENCNYERTEDCT